MLCNPFEMKDVEAGVRRIMAAVERGEQITIYGDYDVDGVTSVCTLYLYLKSVGANINYYIPHRSTDGYGVSRNAIDALSAAGTDLIVTVDTGITANDEVDYAKTLGIDFVVTDHHECRSELPSAAAVINPHRPDCPYPFKELAGVGVVFKLISGYEEMRTSDSRYNVAARLFETYADLVAIGTIADVMPVRGENRLIVSYGLRMMEHNRRIGLAALIDAASGHSEGGKPERHKKRAKITSGYIGFTLAPRINAAGRILSASRAVELFLAQDYQTAFTIATELCAANKERQNEENKIIKDADRKMIDYADASRYPVIVLDADDWHHGVIGIVSSRITEKYFRPSILVSFEGSVGEHPSPEDVGKGSGRSIKGMNLVDALCYCDDTLVKFGGHELAAGLSVTRANLPLFRERINEYARENLAHEDMTPTIEADDELGFSDISLAFAESLQVLEPYGVANPIPAFILRGATVAEIHAVSEGKHSKLTLSDGTSTLTAMCFSTSPEALGLYVGDRADVLFNIDINEWLGRRTVQLIIKDIRISELQTTMLQKEREQFERIWGGEAIPADEDVIPTRDDFATIYRLLLTLQRGGVDTISHREILSKLAASADVGAIGYVKLKVIVKVLMELNIVSIEERDEVYTFCIRYSSGKTDLEKSTLLRRLRSQLQTRA